MRVIKRKQIINNAWWDIVGDEIFNYRKHNKAGFKEAEA